MTNQGTQIRAFYVIGLAITVLAAIAVAGSVRANSDRESTNMDVSAIMAGVDLPSLPVHEIKDAY